MSILPSSDTRHQAGPVENTPRFYPGTPTYLKTRRIFDSVAIPVEVLHLHRLPGIKNAVSCAEVYAVIHGHTSLKKPGTWVSAETIAREIERTSGVPKAVSRRSVEFALKALEDGGWIARTWEPIQGQDQRVIWALWRIPDDGTGMVFDFGYGVKVDVGQLGSSATRKPTIFSAPMGAGNAPSGAATPAPELAPESEENQSNTILIVASTNTNNSEIGEGEQEAPRAELEAPPCPAPRSVEDIAAELANMGVGAIKFPKTGAALVHALVDAGREDLVPEELRGDRRPPKPEPDPVPTGGAPVAQPRRIGGAAVAKPAPALKVPLASLQTQTLLGRIREETPAARREIVEILADRQAEAWDNRHSLNCWRSTLELVAGGKLDPAIWWKAFVDASAASAGYQGSTFNTILKPHKARIRKEARPG